MAPILLLRSPGGRAETSFTLAVANGRGSLTISRAGCNITPIAVTISPAGEINGQGDLNCPLGTGGREPHNWPSNDRRAHQRWKGHAYPLHEPGRCLSDARPVGRRGIACTGPNAAQRGQHRAFRGSRGRDLQGVNSPAVAGRGRPNRPAGRANDERQRHGNRDNTQLRRDTDCAQGGPIGQRDGRVQILQRVELRSEGRADHRPG